MVRWRAAEKTAMQVRGKRRIMGEGQWAGSNGGKLGGRGQSTMLIRCSKQCVDQ